MTPNKFIAYQERRLGRRLTESENDAIERARLGCKDGKRDTVKAMWAAVRELGL